MAYPPYKELRTVSSEIGVLENNENGNFLFYLKNDEYGPVIVDSDFDRGREKFIKAFEKMLIFKSLLSIEDAREKVAAMLKEAFPHASDESNLKDAVIEVAVEAKKKFEAVKKEVNQLSLAD